MSAYFDAYSENYKEIIAKSTGENLQSASFFAEQKATFESLLSHAHAQWLMLSPELLRRLGVRDPEAIAKEMQAAMQQKTMMEQGVAGRGEPLHFQNQSISPSPQNPGVRQ